MHTCLLCHSKFAFLSLSLFGLIKGETEEDRMGAVNKVDCIDGYCNFRSKETVDQAHKSLSIKPTYLVHPGRLNVVDFSYQSDVKQG